MSVRASPDDDNPHVKAIRSALDTEGLPFASGIKDVSRYNLVLYYDSYIGGPVMHCRIDFGDPVSDAEVRQLAGSAFSDAAADDEAHPKLSFSTTFDPHSTGIVDAIRDRALEGQGENKDIRVELGLLSVYGSEVKSYRVVPRMDTAFASVVVVLPTNYAGGALRFRHGGKEYPFDTATSTAANPHQVAFLAFFNDTDHDVDIVQSGWRVTLTYYLSLKEKHPRQIPENVLNITLIQPLLQAINGMCKDEGFLTRGGALGFGLRNRYGSGDLQKARLNSRCLKGSDVLLWAVCRWAGIDCRLGVVYKNKVSWVKTTSKAGRPLRHPVWKEKDVYVLCDEVIPSAQMQGSNNMLWQHLITNEKGKLLTPFMGYKRDVKIRWIVDIIPATGQRVSFLDPNQQKLAFVEMYHVTIIYLSSTIQPGTTCLDADYEDSGKDVESDEGEETDEEEDEEEVGDEAGG